jgi:serine/threonine protein phosphatase PrpC
MFHRNLLLGSSSLLSLCYFSSPLALAEQKQSQFRYAVTLNPYFEKRDEMGEDNYVVRDRFICVTDGVGGWIRKLVKTGKFTKEYVQHIAHLYDKNEYETLKDLLDNASKMTIAKGSSTCVMAELTKDKPNWLKTCNLGDSGYLVVRPQYDGKNGIVKLYRSKSQ